MRSVPPCPGSSNNLEISKANAAPVSETILAARALTRHFATPELIVRAIDGLDIEIRAGEFLALQGASGSGKSTLLALLAGLDRPTSGAIEFKGRRVDSISESEMAKLRRENFGFVFQAFHLVPSLTLMENVALVLSFAGAEAPEERAMELLGDVGLRARADFLPERVSGGEKQRAAIARALANDPAVLFADEPTGNLDSKNGEAVLELLRERTQARGKTLVLVSHDLAIASRAERIIELRDGKILGSRNP